MHFLKAPFLPSLLLCLGYFVSLLGPLVNAISQIDSNGTVVNKTSKNETFSNTEVSDYQVDLVIGTLLVGKDISSHVYRQLCPRSDEKFKIDRLCNAYISCGNEMLTIHNNTDIVNPDLVADCVSVDGMPSIRNFFRFYNSTSNRETRLKTENEGEHEIDSPTAYHHNDANNSLGDFVIKISQDFSTSKTNIALPQTQFTCSANGNFSYNKSCTKFTQCLGSVAYISLCPSGMAFNPELKICDNTKNAANCSEQSNENPRNYELSEHSVGMWVNKQAANSTSSRVEQKATLIKREAPQLQKKEMSKSCSHSDYYVQPHSEHCNKFEICSNGKIKEQTCGLGTLFNPLSLVCDHPYSVDCQSRRIDFSTYDCSREDKYRASHPDKCEQFIECDKGTLHIKSCPPSTAFNFEESECTHIYKAKCRKPISLHDDEEHDFTVNYIPQRSKRSVPRNPLNLDCSFNYIAPHPHFCNKFVECEQGRIFIKDCGPGTAYNPRLGQCDWPYNVRQTVPDDCGRYRQCGSRGQYVEMRCGRGTIYDGEKGKCIFSTGGDYDLNCRRQLEIVTPRPS